MSATSSNKSGCLGTLFKLLGFAPSSSDTEPFPFRLRDDFLSPAEISFYHVLLSAVGDRFTVCPKVNLNDIFFVSRPDKNQAARNRISRKHVDFLLCDRRSMRPCMGIELDDSSHECEDRQARDALVQRVFDAAGLTLLRFAAQRAYSITEVASRLSLPFDRGVTPPSLPVSADTAVAPSCPKCGIPLVIRSGGHGRFFGCSNFPRCRETVAIS